MCELCVRACVRVCVCVCEGVCVGCVITVFVRGVWVCERDWLRALEGKGMCELCVCACMCVYMPEVGCVQWGGMTMGKLCVYVRELCVYLYVRVCVCACVC